MNNNNLKITLHYNKCNNTISINWIGFIVYNNDYLFNII